MTKMGCEVVCSLCFISTGTSLYVWKFDLIAVQTKRDRYNPLQKKVMRLSLLIIPHLKLSSTSSYVVTLARLDVIALSVKLSSSVVAY